MTFKPGRTSLLVAALAGLGASAFAPTAHAWPTTSPSAKTAARLKYHPPKNWLQHYLPDDRYKIAGGIWKVVSTQYDTYYHRPDSQFMLKQPAGIVIGFASEQEAKEAGYRSAGGYGAGLSTKNRSAIASITVGRGRNKVTVRGPRVALSDGSTVILPAGWRLEKTGVHVLGTGQTAYDFIKNTSDDTKSIIYQYVNGNGTNMEDTADAANLKNVLNKFAQGAQRQEMSGFVTNAGTSGASGQKPEIIATKLSGMNGSILHMAGSKPGVTGTIVKAARRDKSYTFILRRSTYDSAMGRAIVLSFRTP